MDGPFPSDGTDGDPRAVSRPTVLVVDDQLRVRDAMRDMVELLGYTSEGATSGEEALARLAAVECDLVLTDLAMPEMSGWDLIQAMRLRQIRVPVVIVTGYATDRDLQRALEEGIPLLRKPFRIAELQIALGDALSDCRA
jgi:two-component system response regulator AtoC